MDYQGSRELKEQNDVAIFMKVHCDYTYISAFCSSIVKVV